MVATFHFVGVEQGFGCRQADRGSGLATCNESLHASTFHMDARDFGQLWRRPILVSAFRFQTAILSDVGGALLAADAAIEKTGNGRWVDMRVLTDTEFTNLRAPELISIALVAENGGELYGELTDFDQARCSDFVRVVVLPQLGTPDGRSMPFMELGREVQQWLGRISPRNRPVVCYDFDGDFYLLLGGVLPARWRHKNIWTKLSSVRLDEFFAEHGHRHHALWDARAILASLRPRGTG